MALHIRNDEADRLARELAEATGKSLTDAVLDALRGELLRHRGRSASRGLASELLEIGARCASLPVVDARSADEILGYDQHGAPTW